MGETPVLFDWCWVSKYDLGDDCGDGESLLDGCVDGDCGGLCGVSVQFDIFGAVAGGGFVAVVFEAGETGT